MKKESFKSKLSELKSDMLNSPVITPMQQIVPIEKQELKKKYTQISAYIEDDILEFVKIKCLKEKKKMSPLIEELLKSWLEK